MRWFTKVGSGTPSAGKLNVRVDRGCQSKDKEQIVNPGSDSGEAAHVNAQTRGNTKNAPQQSHP